MAPDGQPHAPARQKAQLRTLLLAARAAADVDVTTAVAAGLAASGRAWFEQHGVPAAVATYLPVGDEPDVRLLLRWLSEAGARLLVPVLLPSAHLDWVAYHPGEPLTRGLRGTAHPDGVRLGSAAIASADVLLAPALAVDRHGHRLGRGGGSFDRALATLPAGPLVLAVVRDEEVLDHVPAEAHDRAVDGALTPGGVLIFRPVAGG